jgi:hypothetical protein
MNEIMKLDNKKYSYVIGTFDSVADKAEKTLMDCHVSRFLNKIDGK